jgi:hypothetical protein
MIVLRGMERGVLLWNGKGTVFLPWASINSVIEEINDAASRSATGSGRGHVGVFYCRILTVDLRVADEGR